MPKNNVNPYELDILAESTHTIPTTSFKSNTIQIYNTTFTFESIITKANVPVGKGVTVYIYHKGLGTLLSKTETDEESKVYVPNLSKHNEYMVVAVDPKDIYNSVIFDINFDLSSKLNNNVTLKYYSIYDVPNLQQLYSYWDTTTDQRIDPSVLFFISNPNFKDDLGISWGMTGTVRSTTIEGARAFTFSNSGENIYVYHNPVPPKSAFTFSAYVYVDSNNRNTTTNNNIFKHNTQSLYIDSNLKLNYKNTDSSNTFHVMSNTSVNLDSWNHVSISFDNSKLYLFINGVLQASISNASGMSYADSTFIIGDSFKGYITQPLMNDICKYTEDFDFLLKAFSYKTNVYSDPTDTLAEYVRVKLSSTRLTYGLRDEVNNISFSSGLENKYFTPLSTNTRMLAYTKQEPKVALGNRDFCIELKVKFKSMTGYPRLICNNNNTWTTNCWTLDVNRTDSANLYSLHVYNIGNWTFNYPVILNELVDLALVREGVNLKYYVNGYLDKTINIGTGSFDDSTTSFIAMAYTMNINFYELRITTNHSRYTTTYEPKQLEWPDNELAFDQYKIINMPFKQYTSDNQSVLSFTNTNVSLSTDESLNGTKSAYFNNSKIVSNSKLLITNEKFTIEMFYKPKVGSLTGVVSIVSILNSFRLGTKEGLLSFFNGTTWEDSTYLLDDTKFNHIVIQRTGSTIKLLADGNLVLTTTYTIPSGLKTITIGCFNDTEYVNGYVNNLIMYKNITKFQDQYTVPTEEIIVKPPVDLQPEVIVNQYTTSALDFENGLIDQIGTTVWNKQGTGNVTSVNKIFGDNSFETKALGDFLYTNSNIITGGATPFTIEFYALIKGSSKNSGGYPEFTYPLISKNNNSGGGEQSFSIMNNMTPIIFRNSAFAPFSNVSGNYKFRLNEINKNQIVYDGAAIRWFINDELAVTVGTLKGFRMDASTPFTFYNHTIPSYPQYNTQTKGIIDNINIFDGEARVVRDYDEHADKLIVDLAFDGENNSTKIVDNGTGKLNWTVNGNAKISTDQKFDGFSSLYLNNGRVNGSLTDSLWVSDFTIDFDIIRMDDNNNSIFMWGRMLCLGDNSTNGGLYIARENMSSNIIVDLYQSGYVRLFTTTDSPLVHNKRVNIKLIRENGVFHLYINNILKFSNSGYTSYNISKTNAMIGGNNVDREYINGYIKNFKIYKDVAIIPESPVGKIQLDFDNNLADKYNNSTWTNNGVTFDQVNSVKGYAAKFDGANKYLQSNYSFFANNIRYNFDLKTNSAIPNKILRSASNAYQMNIYANGTLSLDGRFDLPVNTILHNTYYKHEYVGKTNLSLYKLNDVVIAQSNVFTALNWNDFLIGDNGSFGNFNMDNFKATKDSQDVVIIDKPAVHLPLETNAINTGFTPLTINSVGNPTYTTVDGKKCIKFEAGKYLTINSNNIFNLGTSSDFYIEMDIYIPSLHNTGYGHTILNNGLPNGTDGMWLQYLPTTLGNDAGKVEIVRYTVGQTTISHRSSNAVNVGAWNSLKFYRSNDNVYIELNDVVSEFLNDINLNFSNGNTHIGMIYNVSTEATMDGYMSNFKMFVGTSEIPETYNDKKVLDLDFKPTRKSYLFKDNNNKCVIHPVNITQRDYQDSQYCCSFNGVDQYLQLGKNDLLNFGYDDYVLEFEFKVVSDGTWNILLGNGATSSDSNYHYVGVSENTNVNQPNKVYLTISSISMFTTNIVDTLNINHLIIIKEGNLYTLRLNGLDTVFTYPNLISNFNYLNNTQIGSTQVSNWVNHLFKGEIYSVKVLRNTSDISLLDS